MSEEEQKNLSSNLNRIIETLEAQIGDEPLERGGNQFHDHFGGHPGWPGKRGFQDGNFDPQGGMEGGYPGDGQFDPRLEMGRHHRGKMLFGRRTDNIPFDHRPGMNPSREESSSPSQDKLDKE